MGLLAGVQGFLSDDEARHFPPDKMLYLCTGSQGEPRAALSRMADGSHPHVKLGQGDACIFSSRVIPGNEIPIRNLQNKLADRGVRLYTERDHPGIHVSGHPCRDELTRMYQWARPTIAVPTHGERRHLLEHAALAKDLQVPQTVAPRNGDMVRLAPGAAGIIDEVASGRLFVDAGVVTSENGQALRERRHASFNGVITASVVFDATGEGRGRADPEGHRPARRATTTPSRRRCTTWSRRRPTPCAGSPPTSATSTSPWKPRSPVRSRRRAGGCGSGGRWWRRRCCGCEPVPQPGASTCAAVVPAAV